LGGDERAGRGPHHGSEDPGKKNGEIKRSDVKRCFIIMLIDHSSGEGAVRAGGCPGAPADLQKKQQQLSIRQESAGSRKTRGGGVLPYYYTLEERAVERGRVNGFLEFLRAGRSLLNRNENRNFRLLGRGGMARASREEKVIGGSAKKTPSL